MSKKEELEKIVRGKGISALRPEIDDSSPDNLIFENFQLERKEHLSSSHPDKEKSSFLSERPIEIQKAEEIQLNKNCFLSEVIPDINEQELIQRTIREDLHQIYILEAYLSQDGTRGAVFKHNLPLTLNIYCYASGLLGQLKPELDISWISYDILRMQIQPAYQFSVRIKPLWQYFKLKYQIQSSLPGLFRYHVVVEVMVADLFCVKEGSIFKIA